MIQIDGSSLSVKQIASVAAGSEKVELGKSARLNVQKSRKNLEKHIAEIIGNWLSQHDRESIVLATKARFKTADQ